MLWVEKPAVFTPTTVPVLLSILDKLGAAFWMIFGTGWFPFCCSFSTNTVWAFTDLEKLTYIIKLVIRFGNMSAIALTLNLFFLQFI